MASSCDIAVLGGGIAGLWVAARLTRLGFNTILIEKDALGAGQTLASQGMIHGGQKYTLRGTSTGPAARISVMPQRWDEALAGSGDIDLSKTRTLSETQHMWPSSVLAVPTVLAAAKMVNSGMTKLAASAYPKAISQIPKFKGPVYELPERVLDIKTLVEALTDSLNGRLFKGEVTALSREGYLTVSGQELHARAVICTAGIGNEEMLRLLGEKGNLTQRRPVHQIMVKLLPDALYGHIAAVASPRPRATITSHSLPGGGYVWYLGGSVAEKSVGLNESAAITLAAREMKELFPHIDWQNKEWATCPVDRGESEAGGSLPPGPHIHPCGRVLIAWPAKLTFAPALADRVEDWLHTNGIVPCQTGELPALPAAPVGLYPWEKATWRNAT